MRKFTGILVSVGLGVAGLVIGSGVQTASADPFRLDLNPGSCPAGFTKTSSSGAYPTKAGEGLVYTCQAVVNCPISVRSVLNGPRVTREQWYLPPHGPHMVSGGSGPFGPVQSISGSGSMTFAFTCSYTTPPAIH